LARFLKTLVLHIEVIDRNMPGALFHKLLIWESATEKHLFPPVALYLIFIQDDLIRISYLKLRKVTHWLNFHFLLLITVILLDNLT